jgi:hypothetical protein
MSKHLHHLKLKNRQNRLKKRMQIWRFKILSWSTGSSQKKSSQQLVDIGSCRIGGWEVMAVVSRIFLEK